MHTENQLVYRLHYQSSTHKVSNISHLAHIHPIWYSQQCYDVCCCCCFLCFIWTTSIIEECLQSLIWKLHNPSYHSGSPTQALLSFSVCFLRTQTKKKHLKIQYFAICKFNVEFAFHCRYIHINFQYDSYASESD